MLKLSYLSIALLAVSMTTSCTVKSSQKKDTANDTVSTINGHRFVDLDLPSGTLWAETNVGAKTATDRGDFYAWGETAPKTDYSWGTYRWGHDFNNTNKYNSNDKLTTLTEKDDVATVQWGAPCRIPTYKEFTELADTTNCLWTWTEIAVSKGDTVRGYNIKSKRNGNQIFLPAAGAHNGQDYYSYGENGVYWTSYLDDENSGNAHTLYFYFANFNFYRNDRSIGSSIRPVATRKQ